MSQARTALACLVIQFAASALLAEIPIPADAPKPLSPAESAAAVELPAGFSLELVAAEPLIRNPSGVCWDERGRLFVCELHGYNMEGQYDIEELNRTGRLDRVVRRLPAPEHARKRAERDQTGTVKRLIDTNGDGRMDEARVWADGLPACFGIVAARGGVIVVCSPHIIFLADRDGDDKAEVRETLFTGFNTGILERRNNAPKWGLDNWIYVGRGQGGTITGPHLPERVTLPGNDFRFKADGSAIEPVPDGTHTFGFSFSETGDRFVISTRTPAIYVAPLPWRYLERNPDVSIDSLRVDVGPGPRTYPVSKPHPWRTRRANDPGFEAFYRGRYGAAESQPNGYFTSACSPLVYQDTALPGLRGHLLACEPAQNLVHRSVIQRSGLIPKLVRHESEQQREFLASRDIWFHPMALAHAPDGSVAIVDFYREIIEDYSAIPRYLQQQYRLNHGEQHGRIWRLVHEDMQQSPPADMSKLNGEALAREISSPRFWRRQTAQRLIVERRDIQSIPTLRSIIADATGPAAVIGSLHTLEGMSQLASSDLVATMQHENAGVVVEALRLADRRFRMEPGLLHAALQLIEHSDPRVRIQLGLSLGETDDRRARLALAALVLNSSELRWLPESVLTSLHSHADEMLAAILNAERPDARRIRHTASFLQRLCAMIGNAREPDTISRALRSIAGTRHQTWQHACLAGLRDSFDRPRPITLSDAGRKAVTSLQRSRDKATAEAARALVISMRIESEAQRKQRLVRASRAVGNLQLTVAERVAAVNELAAEGDKETIEMLLAAFAASTPSVREAILNAAFSRNEFAPVVVAAMERKRLPAAAVSAVRRSALLKHADEGLRERAEALMTSVSRVDEALLKRFTDALARDRDPATGATVFRKHCASCHQAHGVGLAVGPDLTAEFRRSEGTIVRDILAPSASISAGYVTYVVETSEGTVHNGLLVSETPTGITLRQKEGKQRTVLRKDIAALRALDISMMPEKLASMLQPQDVADVIAWIRQPSPRRILFDDDPAFVDLLTDGDGAASLELNDRHRGSAALRVTPPQRYSASISGWRFKVRERPAPGEYRYVRFAWKSVGAAGIMIEMANKGSWPPAGKAAFRYYAGENTTGWQATRVSPTAPADWQVVTRDLWQDFGDCTITGIAPTTMGGPALFDAIELTREVPE